MSGRVVSGLVDGADVYSSRLAAAAGYAFLGGPARGPEGRLAAEAAVAHPYRRSPTAHARAQAQALLDGGAALLAPLGAGLDDLVQLEQYVATGAHAHGYLTTLRGPRGIATRRPASALAASGPMAPPEAVVNALLIAALPQGGRAKEIVVPFRGDAAAHLPDPTMREAPYAEVVGAGPYLFTLGDVAFELGAGVHPDVRQPDWTWFGSEIAAEAEHNLALLSERLEAAGSDLAHVVHATVMVADTADLRELDDVWERAFPQAPPARTVVPVTGLASPRRAGARGHGENAVRYMTMCRAVRRDAGPATVVPDRSGVLGAASGAVAAAGLLWVSGQCAADPDGLPAGSGATAQAAVAFERVRALCEAGGTSLGELLVLRAFAADREAIDAVHALVREAFPADPPVVIALPVAGPPAIDGVRVTLDAIAHVPTAAPTEVQP